ncbi:LysE family translocator [Stappia sp. MMSF_3263]|uniref:LysE family translocator n=1 Tax=Stappia sp. MMSF_3263 TaxID=3046693 RepID=UPI00273EDC05|nr:LysE family translocator [Stappia sp. MMSF_3263]
MAPEQLIAFATFAFVASATPGPNNVLLTAIGSSVGIRRGMPALWGIVFGFAAMIFALAIGLGGTLFTIAYVMDAIRIVGVLVLLWLAWKIATAPVGPPASSDEMRPRDIGRRGGFIGAALFQWVNPKAWIVAAGAITAYMQPDGESALYQAGTLAGVFVVAAAIGCLPWLAFGAAVGTLLENPKLARGFNIAMAVLLVASMVPVILERA